MQQTTYSLNELCRDYDSKERLITQVYNEKYIAVCDLEATCFENKQKTREEGEIIEIGSVIVEIKSLNVVSKFQTFVKPTINPSLSEFCINLTSISQNEVQNAPNIIDSLIEFSNWLDSYEPFLFACWGDYDASQIAKEVQRNNAFQLIPNSKFSNYLNIKRLYSIVHQKKRLGMMNAMKYLDLQHSGVHHRGIDDATNIANILLHILNEYTELSSFNKK